MKTLFTFEFHLTSAKGEDYTAVHGFSVDLPVDPEKNPFDFAEEMEDKYSIVHDFTGCNFENSVEVVGFTTYEAESHQIKEIMKDWHDHFVSLGLKCSRVHFLGILSETGKQDFTEEDYLRFHEKWTAEAA